MKVVLQRVEQASCLIDGKIYSQIKEGYLLLVAFCTTDHESVAQKLAKKIVNLRIFSDANGKMNLNLAAVSGAILSISQFTLYADPNTGNRPSFTKAMAFNEASQLYDKFNQYLREYGVDVQTGVFGADMQISLINDGPVTIIYEEEGE